MRRKRRDHRIHNVCMKRIINGTQLLHCEINDTIACNGLIRGLYVLDNRCGITRNLCAPLGFQCGFRCKYDRTRGRRTHCQRRAMHDIIPIVALLERILHLRNLGNCARKINALLGKIDNVAVVAGTHFERKIVWKERELEGNVGVACAHNIQTMRKECFNFSQTAAVKIEIAV